MSTVTRIRCVWTSDEILVTVDGLGDAMWEREKDRDSAHLDLGEPGKGGG